MGDLDFIDYDDVDYDWLVEAGKERSRDLGTGHGVNDLLAMSQICDPFYQGTEGDHRMSKWLREGWKLLGLDAIVRQGKKVHLRQVHYLLLSRSADVPRIPLHGAGGRIQGYLPYRNTLQCWKLLTTAFTAARYLGYIPFGAIQDQRNPDPKLYAQSWERDEYEPTVKLNPGWQRIEGLPSYMPFLAPRIEVSDYDADQRYHLEVWVEKSTVEDVLDPLCRLYRANLMFASGEFSITQIYQAAQRIARSGRSARIFYITDYDLKGQEMPVSAGRKLEWFIHAGTSPLQAAFEGYEAAGCNVTLTPIALTQAQIRRYNLPRQPLKDQRGKSDWELMNGEGGVELDALVALRPGTLESIVRGHLSPCHDMGLTTRVAQAQQQAQERMNELVTAVEDGHEDELDELEEAYAEVRNELTPKLEGLKQRAQEIVVVMNAEVEEAMAGVSITDEFPVPEPDEAQENPDLALVWSERSYDEQLDSFHEFQGRDSAAYERVQARRRARNAASTARSRARKTA